MTTTALPQLTTTFVALLRAGDTVLTAGPYTIADIKLGTNDAGQDWARITTTAGTIRHLDADATVTYIG